jgi:hypothetical protein
MLLPTSRFLHWFPARGVAAAAVGELNAIATSETTTVATVNRGAESWPRMASVSACGTRQTKFGHLSAVLLSRIVLGSGGSCVGGWVSRFRVRVGGGLDRLDISISDWIGRFVRRFGTR